MGKIAPSKVQEIIFASSEKKESRRITELLKELLVSIPPTSRRNQL
jgi:hypothetical protein